MAPDIRIRTKRLALEKDRFSLIIDKDGLRIKLGWVGVAHSTLKSLLEHGNHMGCQLGHLKKEFHPRWEVEFYGC